MVIYDNLIIRVQSGSPPSERILSKMKQLLKTRLAKKFQIDPENPILGREVEWYMRQRKNS